MKVAIKNELARFGLRLQRLTDEERRLIRGFDPRCGPPPADLGYLVPDNPELRRLEADYRESGSPSGRTSSTWTRALRSTTDDLRYFRGDTLYLWQYSRSPDVNRYRYFIHGQYVASNDEFALLGDRLTEDGAFGCFTFAYPGMPLLSRDLLESVNELTFLGKNTGLFSRADIEILDIGAGYGRLAHRTLEAAPNVRSYWCIDGVARSTFLSRYYLRYRELEGRAHVLDLHDRRLERTQIDLAVNVHSFSEMPRDSINGWLSWLADLDVPQLMVVPNERDRVLSREGDGRRLDCSDLFREHGYHLSVSEPVFRDAAVRDLLNVEDHLLLFERRGSA